MQQHFRLYGLCAVFWLSCVGNALLFAQNAVKEPEQLRTNSFQFVVTVRDSQGRAVAGLQSSDFTMWANDEQSVPVNCEPYRAPLQLLLLIDETSGFAENPAQLNALLRRFCQSLQPTDFVSVIQFSDAIVLTKDWTSIAAAPKKLFHPKRRPAERAPIYDALIFAAMKQHETIATTSPNRVIVLLTNGLNSTELVNVEEANTALHAANVTLYAFSETETIAQELRQTRQRAKDETSAALSLLLAESDERLTRITSDSGGKLYFPLRPPSLSWMLQDLHHELRSQYLLTFQSPPSFFTHQEPSLLPRFRIAVPGSHQVVSRIAMRNGI